jgi:hypothetical protein
MKCLVGLGGDFCGYLSDNSMTVSGLLRQVCIDLQFSLIDFKACFAGHFGHGAGMLSRPSRNCQKAPLLVFGFKPRGVGQNVLRVEHAVFKRR